MTSRDVLTCLGRGWVMVLLGTLVTLCACFVVRQPDDTFWARSSVYFLAPTDDENNNSFAFTTDSVIATAGLVAQLVEKGDVGPSTSTDTSLVAEGVREGTRVRVPNSGGQWALNYDRPVLDVQAVSDDPEAVRTKMDHLLSHIDSTLARIQRDDGVPSRGRIRSTRTPSVIQVYQASGDANRAAGATLMLGAALTCVAAVAWERLRESWRERRSRPSPGESSVAERSDLPSGVGREYEKVEPCPV